MKRDLEESLWGATRGPGEVEGRPPRMWIEAAVANGLIESPKQAWAVLKKWAAAGHYDYGVSIDMGWRKHRGPCPGGLV